MRNYLIFIIKSSLADLARNKGRTFLTSLGILIGVMSVVLLMAAGLGLRKYISDQFESLGANLIFAMPGSKKSVMRGGGIMGGIRFDDKDVSRIKRLSKVTAVAPVFANPGMEIEANAKTEIVEMVASTEQVVPVFNLEVEAGRLIEKKDNDKRAKIVNISATTAKTLYGSAEDALNKNLKIGKQNFKVTGVLKTKGGGGLAGAGMDSHIYIPFKSSFSFNPDKKYYAIYLKSETKEDVIEVKGEVEKVLLKRYDKDDFSVMEQSEIMDTVAAIFGVINIVLISIAAISLIVGGIGIMNIMYVSVTERIKEIGIRRAIGAYKKDILWQFLTMSTILSLFGGLVGLLIAYVIVLLIQPLFPAYIDITTISLALGVSSAIGIVFGVFPAKKAADLSPIDAIRYE